MKQGLTVKTLYEDKYLMVVYKPEGLMTVPYEGYRGKTLIGILVEQRRKRGLVHGSFRPQAVHRLDRDTSGIMMVALTPDVQKRVMDNWQTLVTKRCYRALAELPRGPFPLENEGTIDAPLTKNAKHHSFVAESGVRAITHYKVLNHGAHYALLELELETGRTNQIRAHLAFKGCPIAGDTQYRAHTDPDHRMCLHARSLEFTHPVTGEKLSFEASEPPSWEMISRK